MKNRTIASLLRGTVGLAGKAGRCALALVWVGGMTGCICRSVRLPPDECRQTLVKLRSIQDGHQDPLPCLIAQGQISYEEFREYYAEPTGPGGAFLEPGASRPKTTRYKKTDAEIRQEFERLAAEPLFDANDLVDALPHVSIKPGYTLDYVLLVLPPGGDGWPVFYARKVEHPPFPDWQSYSATFPDFMSALKQHYVSSLELDGSPMSFFELAVLLHSADDFYRDGGAIREDRIFCTSEPYDLLAGRRSGAEDTATQTLWTWLLPPPPPDVAALLQRIDMAVYVTICRAQVTVSFVSVGSRYGGVRHWWTFSRAPPHRNTQRRLEQIVPPWNMVER